MLVDLLVGLGAQEEDRPVEGARVGAEIEFTNVLCDEETEIGGVVGVDPPDHRAGVIVAGRVLGDAVDKTAVADDPVNEPMHRREPGGKIQVVCCPEGDERSDPALGGAAAGDERKGGEPAHGIADEMGLAQFRRVHGALDIRRHPVEGKGRFRERRRARGGPVAAQVKRQGREALVGEPGGVLLELRLVRAEAMDQDKARPVRGRFSPKAIGDAHAVVACDAVGLLTPEAKIGA